MVYNQGRCNERSDGEIIMLDSDLVLTLSYLSMFGIAMGMFILYQLRP
jgi:hypothetical protein